ncbi:MAG: hypothetical protein KAI86_04665 [Desulfobacterales bacterium]|nr:hypothetical protein [Desulfobacterales bacterium]
MPGVTELVNAAVERGETFESMGAGKASKRDLTYYVLELADEAHKETLEQQYKDGVIGAALNCIWTDGE